MKNLRTFTFIVMAGTAILSCKKETNEKAGINSVTQNSEVRINQPLNKNYLFNEKIRLYDNTKINYVEYVVRSNNFDLFEYGKNMLKNSSIRFFSIPENGSELGPQVSAVNVSESKESDLIWEEVYRSNNSMAYEITSCFSENEANSNKTYVNIDASSVTIQTICHNIEVCNASSNNLLVACAHWNYGGWINTNSDIVYWNSGVFTCEGHLGESGSYTRKSVVTRLNGSMNNVFNYTVYP